MKPELVDYLVFITATLLFLAACRYKKRRDSKRVKPSPEHVLLPLIESRPLPCKLCPVHGVCKEMQTQ